MTNPAMNHERPISPGTPAHGSTRFVGRSIPRREDPRLLTGAGRFVDDIVVPGALHAAFVRSDVARGVLTRVALDHAMTAEGVVTVFAGEQINALAGPMFQTSIGPPNEVPYPPMRVLADGDVRFVGEPIAMVVATSRYLAEDAAELVVVDVDPEPPVLFPSATRSESLVHPEWTSNVASAIATKTADSFEEKISGSARVVTRTFRQSRATNAPMEGRGIIASYRKQDDTLDVFASHQNPHEVKLFCARLLGMPESSVRVQQFDVGGGFGQKLYVTRDEAAVVLASKLLSRPVKWIEDRHENLITANQAREEQLTVTMAVSGGGEILGMKATYLEDVGAYPLPSVGTVAPFVQAMLPGPYRITSIGFDSEAMFTNTVGRAPYRGPWLMECVAREQMMDHVARVIGMDPLEFRRRNVLHVEDLPHSLPSGFVYDVMTADQTLEQAVRMIGYDEFRQRQVAARADGRLLGIGLSLFVEPSGIALGARASEQADISMEPGGNVVVRLGTGNHGQGIETTIPQIVADYLGCDIRSVVLHQGDTQGTPFGTGTSGSRSAVNFGGAVIQAAEVLRAKLLAIGAHFLEAAVDDLEVADARITVRGTPTRYVEFSDLAAIAYANPARLPPTMEMGLTASYRFRPAIPITWSNACHACICEVNAETGLIRILRYVVSEDCGVMINPMVVEGQIAGGVAQGIGGALYEHLVYDDNGNPLTTTFLDYLLPTASSVPCIEYGHVETPSRLPGGFKGMGEGGAIGTPAAVANAVSDALAHLDVCITDLPLSPTRVLEVLDRRTGRYRRS